jgi:hypothetical protein
VTKKKGTASHTPAQIARLKEHALVLYSNDVLNARHLGEALIAVKKAIGHGQFNKWLAAKKVDRNRASYCMRVAQGKVAAAKLKHATKRTAEGEAREVFGKFLKSCANSRAMQTVEQLASEMSGVFFSTIKSVCEIRSWRLNKPKDVQQAMDQYEEVVCKTLDALFVIPVSESDAPRASDYFRKSPARTQVAAAGKR